MSIEFKPHVQEFASSDVIQSVEDWRIEQTIRIHQSQMPGVLRVAIMAVGVFLCVGAYIPAIRSIQAASVDWALFSIQLSWAIALTAITLFVVMWGSATTKIQIDWDQDRFSVARGLFCKTYRLSTVESVDLDDDEEAGSASLSLKINDRDVVLLNTTYISDSDERLGSLHAPGRRLAASLGLELQLPPDSDVSTWNVMTDEELADSYADQASTLATHQRVQEMKGNTAAAEEYRQHAIYHYQCACELNPNLAAPLLELGKLSGDKQIERQAVDLAVGENEDQWEGLLSRASAHLENDNPALAAADYDRAVTARPCKRTYHERGMQRYWGKQFELAIEDASLGLECDDTDTYISDRDLFELRSDCFRRLYKSTSVSDHLYAAIADIQLAIGLDPDNSFLRATLAELIAETGDHALAIETLDRLHRENPDDFSLLQTRGKMYLDRLHDVPAALSDFDDLVEQLNQLQNASGEAGTHQNSSIAYAYRLRARAKKAGGDFLSADQDIATAQQLEECNAIA